MEKYISYIDRQEISPAVHEKLIHLEARKKSARPWVKYGALAACAALIVGIGVWKLSPAPDLVSNVGSAGQFAADYIPLPGEADVVEPDELFVVNSPADEGEMAFYYMPDIYFQDMTGSPELAASIALPEGAFMVGLEKEDVQRLFWPEGKPENMDCDLPWALFWDGYTIHGYAWYNGQGELFQAHIFGEKDRAAFELTLCPDRLPLACCIYLNRGDAASEAFGAEVTGWSKAYDRDGDDITDYICGSEFMTENNIGVRFESCNNGRVEDGIDGEAWFNILFVREALAGGLHLDHLMANENIPAWREEEFSTLAQARQEADFAPYLPKSDPEGYGEFFGHLTYQEDRENTLHVSWSRHYSSVIINIYREDTYSYNLVSPDEPELYDLRLYPVPWCYSVPEEYHETVDRPAFRAEDMSLEIVEARWNENDTGGRIYSFDVLHPDGTVVSYRFDGMTAEQIWALVEPTL